MQAYSVLAGVALIIVFAVAMRWQYGRAMDKVTDPDQTPVIPVTSPIIGTLCRPGEDCLKFPQGGYR